MTLVSCNGTRKFPHNHRFVPGERIERNPLRFLSWLGRARHANTYRLRTDIFRRMTFQRAAATPSSASGRYFQRSTGERPLGEPQHQRRQEAVMLQVVTIERELPDDLAKSVALVPTLRVGMPSSTLRVVFSS